MSPENLDRVKVAHARALHLRPEQREAFLRAEFPEDRELQDYVLKLLSWNDEAGNFLTTSLSDRAQISVATDLTLKRIGNWQLVRDLGHGGAATVYLACRADGLFQRHVAIKLLNRLAYSDDVFRGFQTEVQALARLEHPYIVRIVDAGTTEEALAYIITEFVDGKPIDEFVAEMTVPEKLRLFIKVCEAVSFAHENAIVHRDLKPSNILVIPNGTPKLLDFGIALLLDQDSRKTLTGFERMTIQYASPEQIRNEREITSACDIYSLGVILYELLTNTSPYDCQKADIANWILFKDPKPMSGISRGLQRIISKALRKRPDDRYRTVEGLTEDLQRYLDGHPVAATDDTGGGERTRLTRRQVGAMSIGFLATTTIGIGVFHELRRSTNHASLEFESVEGRPLSFSFSPDGKRLFFLAGDVFFDYCDLYVRDLSGGQTTRLTHDGVFKIGPAVSPDGKFLAFLRAAGPLTTTLAIIPLDGGGERSLFTSPSGEFGWGRDGRSLIVSHQSVNGIWPHLRGFDMERNEWWDITPPPKDGRGDKSPTLSPNGQTLCFVRQESRESADLYLQPLDRELRPDGTARRLTSRRFRVSRPQWTADGKEIFYLSGTLGNFSVFRVASDGRAEPEQVKTAGSYVESLALPLRTAALIFGTWHTESNIWRLDFDKPGGKEVGRRVLAGPKAEDGAFSPDGKSMVYGSAVSGEPQIWVASSDGSAPRKVTSYPNVDGLSALWLPDGSGLITSVRSRGLGSRNFIVNLQTGWERELTQVKGIPCSFSKDGNWLYFSAIKQDVDIYKYSMATGEVRQVTEGARASYAMEAPGRTVYFSKPEPELGLWMISGVGGEPIQVLPTLARTRLFAVHNDGIYYTVREARSVAIRYRPFGRGPDVEIYRTNAVPSWGLSISSDGRSVLFAQEDVVTAEYRLLDRIP